MPAELNPVSPVSGEALGAAIKTSTQVCSLNAENRINSALGATTVLLPTSYDDDSVVIVRDSGNAAAANPITIDGNGQTIDGQASMQLNWNRGVLAIARDAENSRWTRVLAPRQLDGARVSLYTALDLQNLLRGLTGIGPYAQRPAAGQKGARYVASDSFAEFVDDGTEWRPLLSGQLGYEPPSVAGFTNYSNAGIMGADIPSNVAGCINNAFDNYNNIAEELRCSVKNMPAGNFVCTAFVRLVMTTSGTLLAGLTFRESSTGNVEQFSVEQNAAGTIVFSRHRATASNTSTSPNYAFSASLSNTSAVFNTGLGGTPGVWLRTVDNRAGAREYWFSFDRVNWFECINLRVGGAAFLTADQAGFHAWGSSVVAGGGNIGGLIYSYKESAD